MSRLIAGNPRAWTVGEPPAASVDASQGEIVVVDIRGALESYDAIVDAVRRAVDANASRIILKLDSPGGAVSGLFQAVDEIVALTKNVPVDAYAAGDMCSAAYALACTADKIYASRASVVGSVGVFETLVSQTRAFESQGLDVRLVTSGRKKVQGHPATEIDDDVLAGSQKRVDKLAEMLFELVAAKRGLTIDAVRALEGDVFLGADALEHGLVDALVTSFDAVIKPKAAKQATVGSPKLAAVKPGASKPAAVRSHTLASVKQKFSAGKAPAVDKGDSKMSDRQLERQLARDLEKITMIEKRLAALQRGDVRAPLSADPGEHDRAALRLKMGLGSKQPRGVATAFKLVLGDLTGVQMAPSSNAPLNAKMGLTSPLGAVTMTDRKLILGGS